MEEPYTPPPSLPAGYFLGQEANSVARDALFRRLNPHFGPFQSEDAAHRFFAQLEGHVDGLDYVNYWYTQGDGAWARRLAEIGRQHGVDLWAGLRWQKQFRDLPVVPAECAAWTMEADGRVGPALWEERNHLVDTLNPAAVDWLLDALEERYWPHVRGVVNGLFLPETRVTLLDFPYNPSGVKPWALHAYSPYVLSRWREYCSGHDLRHQGQTIDRFLVPRPEMMTDRPDAPSVRLHDIDMHADRSQNIHVPDDRPESVPTGTPFIDIARGQPLWLAWEEFLCGLYHESFTHRVARRVNRLHAGMPDWRGVCAFNNDVTMLDYRDFRTPGARTGSARGYWPQGRRMGVDLHRMLDDPELTCFISETVQRVGDYADSEENYLSRGMEIAREHGRSRDYGFMVHYCCWEMDEAEEAQRWEMIHRYRPPVFSFYCIHLILTEGGAHFRPEVARRFWDRVDEYKRSWRAAD